MPNTLHHYIINFPVIQTLCSSCHVYIWYIDYVFTSYSMLDTVFMVPVGCGVTEEEEMAMKLCSSS